MHHDTFASARATAMAMSYDSVLMLLLIEYMERYRVGFGRTVCTLVLVHVWIWMLIHQETIIITPLLRLLFKYNANGTWSCADVDGIYGTVPCWLWTNSLYVGIGACLNIQRTMTPSQLHTHLLFNCNDNDIWLCADVDWIYGTVSYWFWTNRTYVGIGACLNSNVYTMHHDAIVIAHSPAIQLQWQWHTALRWCWLNIWNRVGFGRTGGTLVLLMHVYMSHYLVYERYTMTWSQLQTRLLFNYHGNDTWFCADVDWINGTVSCWLWTNRKYVGIGVYLNLNVSLLCIRCTTTQ